MDAEFWRKRWREGQIGFHQSSVTPLLEEFWDRLALPVGSRVFVPLAGKTLDMPWLAGRGYRVLGVELSELAVRQFFDEQGAAPTRRESKYGIHYTAGAIELICGDAFGLDREALHGCKGVYDRAALIALPPELRRRYVEKVYANLPAGCRGLLVTLEYPQPQKAGPPFAVHEDEVRALYGKEWSVDMLDRRGILDSQPGFRTEGVTALDTVAYQIAKQVA